MLIFMTTFGHGLVLIGPLKIKETTLGAAV